VSVGENFLWSRVTLLAHTIFNNTGSKKAVDRALFLTGDYNTKSQKSKKLPGKSKIYKVPHEHDP
jgi:hypothetical protein